MRVGSYEIRAVALLSLGFALVGLDRWIIAPLLPEMMRDLHLTYQDAGNAIGVLGVVWGVSSTLLGRVSDSIGRRRVLIPALLGFSALSGLSGLVRSAGSLLLIRGTMGAMEGAYLPASIAANAEASPQRRRGLNQGIQLCMFALFGLGFGPLIAAALLAATGSWRWVFAVVAIPGLIVAAGISLTVSEPAHLQGDARLRPAIAWRNLFRSRNVVVAMAAIVCAMSCVFVLAGMLPVYLTHFVHLPAADIAIVLSSIGFGGGGGQFLLNWLSDFAGRRNTMLLCFVGAFLSLWLFAHAHSGVPWLFLTLLSCSAFSFGVVSMATGPIATEAVPITLTASAVGIISGTGEVFGGGIAPSAAGWVAEHLGIDKVLWVAFVGLGVGILVSMFLVETAPRRSVPQSLRALPIPSNVSTNR